MTRRVWTNTPAHMPRCWPRLGWTQGSLNALATGRQARALDLQAHPSLPVHALLSPRVPFRRNSVPSKYLSAEPRIAHPGFGDPWPLGSGPDLGFPLGGFVPLPAPGARQAGPGPGPVGPVLYHRPQSVRALVQITLPSPPFPCPLPPKLKFANVSTPGRGSLGRVWCFWVWGPKHVPQPCPTSGHPAPAARPPHPQRNGNRFDR